MLLGQYSVGKTSMISYLLNGTYPGADIGPEPTTDIFAHISYNEFPITIPGTTLVADKEYQFQTLDMFGDVFLNKLRATNFKADLLKHISIIDTPGILTGDKQVAARGYDFSKIIKFLSNKVDLIFLLFDANKLDISDEYKQVIEILDGCEDKIRIVLNKADSVRPRELVHVRGALMWALGKIMHCPEVPKVYIGSFWPFWNDKNTLLRGAIQEDLDALVKDILDLPSSYHAKRINDVIKRARNLRLHSYIMDEVIKSSMFFKNSKNSTDTETQPTKLLRIYHKVARQRRIVLNDFPDPIAFHEKAKLTDPKQWNRLDAKLDKLLNEFLEHDVTPIITSAINEPRVVIEYKPPKKVPLPKDFNAIKKIGDEKANDSNAANILKDEKKEKIDEKEDKASGDKKEDKKSKSKDKEDDKTDSKKHEKTDASKKDDKKLQSSSKKKEAEKGDINASADHSKHDNKPASKNGDVDGKDKEKKKKNEEESMKENNEKKRKEKTENSKESKKEEDEKEKENGKKRKEDKEDSKESKKGEDENKENEQGKKRKEKKENNKSSEEEKKSGKDEKSKDDQSSKQKNSANLKQNKNSEADKTDKSAAPEKPAPSDEKSGKKSGTE
ncbi:EH domain-containing protein 2 [Toxocara canis]|uniref:EH domain-containing protein 2 n=1 Tax=Toxocara canis TaxID=6265 RepID=A0A0B2VAT5_TOXCA|nr:EH domain-containing protein 2 [Toxocara canis]